MLRKVFVLLVMAVLTALVFNQTTFGASSETNQSQTIDAKININTASVKTLTGLPGIGTKTANNIVDYREQKSLFKTPEDLLKVKGIGKKTLKKIENLISFR